METNVLWYSLRSTVFVTPFGKIVFACFYQVPGPPLAGGGPFLLGMCAAIQKNGDGRGAGYLLHADAVGKSTDQGPGFIRRLPGRPGTSGGGSHHQRCISKASAWELVSPWLSCAAWKVEGKMSPA